MSGILNIRKKGGSFLYLSGGNKIFTWIETSQSLLLGNTWGLPSSIQNSRKQVRELPRSILILGHLLVDFRAKRSNSTLFSCHRTVGYPQSKLEISLTRTTQPISRG